MFRNFFLFSGGSYTGHLLEFLIILLKKTTTVDYSSNHVLARLKTDADNPVQRAVAKTFMYQNHILFAHLLLFSDYLDFLVLCLGYICHGRRTNYLSTIFSMIFGIIGGCKL